ATLGGEREHLLLVDLLRREKALFHHAGEGRVDRAGARPPPSRTAGLELGDQLVAVHGALGEHDEHRVAHRPASGPWGPALTRTTSLTHVSIPRLRRRVRRLPLFDAQIVTNTITTYRYESRSTRPVIAARRSREPPRGTTPTL